MNHGFCFCYGSIKWNELYTSPQTITINANASDSVVPSTRWNFVNNVPIGYDEGALFHQLF